MRSTGWGVFVVCLAALPAYGATYSLVPRSSTTIAPGRQITIDVFVDGIVAPDLLNAYQAQLKVTPAGGAVGSLALAGPDPTQSIFIDTTRSDWVFFGIPGAEAFVGANATKLRIAGLDPQAPIEVTSPAYCGSYIFEASPNALGDFQVSFALENPNNPGVAVTFLADEFSNLIPFTVSPPAGLTLTVTSMSVNDNCINSLVVGNGITAVSTVNSTTDGVNLDPVCDEGNGVAINQDVWFNHVASCTGILTVSTCNDADFNTRLAVYGAGLSTCGCPTDNTSLLACSDDAPGCGTTSEVTLPVTAGECLTIRLGGVGAAEGTGNLTITCAPDLCTDAQPINAGSTITGSTANAIANDAIGPNCGLGLADSPGVWYTATGTGNLMTASLCQGTTFNSRLTVYQGSCGALTCVTEANDTCGSQESVSWCSTPGTQYFILVHGVAGARGPFNLSLSDQSCDDGSVCTNDSCSAGTCVNTPNFDGTQFCCTPSTGSLTLIDDGNPCTNDACNPINGTVGHTPILDGPNVSCDDNFTCTLDECIGGVCANTDINTLSCSVDADCPNQTTCGNTTAGLCFCDTRPPLELMADPGTLPVPGCFSTFDTVTVRVEMGFAETPIVGAQFFLSYDPTALSFVRMDPGSTLGGGSPFAIQFQESVDTVQGTIDYVVGVNFGAQTQGPATVAVITFQTVSECGGFVRFRPTGPLGQMNLISAVGGGEVSPKLVDLPPLRINTSPPSMTACPLDMLVNPDPGSFSAAVSWPVPTATDTCDPGAIPVVCNPASGATFSTGTTVVTCSSTDSCGASNSCTFNITVNPSVLSATVELAPSIAPGPVNRCITFDLWNCAAPAGSTQHAAVQQTMSFVNGVASVVDMAIPSGQWTCLTARDELHTLRSTAPDFITTDGVRYTASFVGAPSTGGHWLLGGNLNGDDFIDILDFGVFFPFFLTQATANTPCTASPPDANINGDAVVDLLDLAFVSGNSLQASEPACCVPISAASASSGPIMSIPVRQLRAMGLDDMVEADVNRDGILDVNDIIALVNGDVPNDQVPSSIRDLRDSKLKRRKRPGR